ncbi:hypothetical protein TNCV_2176161 [Trichonephila clavipes]|uniref:Uncharacterized protein n=1 Tax=Trichonephila clavipes TaxID=2585209 RepID=A0A8X6S5F8_TRICX|nr:hypothetical protein TNCV_2176161 [Trichonephila clavipes]
MALSGSLPQINLGVQGWPLDWFEVLGYRVVEDKATDYAHLKQALSEQFPVTDHQIGTSVHAPQHPVVTYIGMGIVDLGPHRLLCH